MDLVYLELRFYSREEIAEITGRKLERKQFARDIKTDLENWGYDYQFLPRRGVRIIGRPTESEFRLKEILVNKLNLDGQVNAFHFAYFISALSTYPNFAAMPYRKREAVMNELIGQDVCESTMRRWAAKLYQSNNAERFQHGALWKTYVDETGCKRQVLVEADSDEYKQFCAVRSATLEELDKQGVPANERWGAMIQKLYKKWGHFYYSPEICLNAFGNEAEEITILVADIMEARNK